MIRSTIPTLVSLTIFGTFLPCSRGQDIPEPVAQVTQQAQAKTTESIESEATVTIPRRDTKPGVMVNKRTREIGTRGPRAMQEVRTAFAFSNDAFRELPLMIRSSRADVKAMEQLSEDLSVMTRLLDKAVAEETDAFQPPKAGGIEIVALGPQNSGRAMYVDDYGVIFTLKVNMPFRAEPKEVEVIQKEPTRRRW
jgi:hypothetical protein